MVGNDVVGDSVGNGVMADDDIEGNGGVDVKGIGVEEGSVGRLSVVGIDCEFGSVTGSIDTSGVRVEEEDTSVTGVEEGFAIGVEIDEGVSEGISGKMPVEVGFVVGKEMVSDVEGGGVTDVEKSDTGVEVGNIPDVDEGSIPGVETDKDKVSVTVESIVDEKEGLGGMVFEVDIELLWRCRILPRLGVLPKTSRRRSMLCVGNIPDVEEDFTPGTCDMESVGRDVEGGVPNGEDTPGVGTRYVTVWE